jgi:enterochelin esterase family protein
MRSDEIDRGSAQMRPELEALRRDAVADPTAVDRFVDGRSFPLIDDGTSTFVYRGEADTVRLRHWVYGLAATPTFTRLDGTDLWYVVLDVPHDSRIEYKIEVIRGDHVESIQDPLNPHTARDPFGANSVLQTTGYERPVWTLPDPEARSGTLLAHRSHSPALGREVDLNVYLPARFRPTSRYPLLIVHDGSDYLDYSAMQVVLDNLIHRLELAEIVVAFSNPQDRLVEYADHEPHASYIADELVPWLETEFPLVAAAGGRGLMGASFGAAASFAVARRHPDMFGRMLLQSGSFAFSDIGESERGPLFAPIEAMVNAFRADPGPFSERVFVSCGTFESLIYENRSLVPVLQSTGMEVRYVEARDGHNWENWRDRLRDGLAWLFPGPLWMVYE